MGKQWQTLFWRTPKSLHMVIAAKKLKDTPWKKSYDQPRQDIKKERHYFINKGPSSQGYIFSSSHVWMWELDYKESRVLKNWLFWKTSGAHEEGQVLEAWCQDLGRGCVIWGSVPLFLQNSVLGCHQLHIPGTFSSSLLLVWFLRFRTEDTLVMLKNDHSHLLRKMKLKDTCSLEEKLWPT